MGRFKVQILNQEEEKWENITKEGFISLTKREAKEKAEYLSNIGPYEYRAVREECPQELAVEV